MTDSKTSHWKSLAADLSGTTPVDENAADATSDLDESTTAHTSSDSLKRTDVTRTPLDEDSNEEHHPKTLPVRSEPPPKKKKRGSWAFWRSGNKEKKDAEENSSRSDSSVSDNPLALLNQAETTDDMACAIDQLFANNGSDTRGDEVVFDADEIATSIDFEEKTKTTSRDADAGGSRHDRRSRSRGEPDSRRRRDEDDGKRRENRGRGQRDGSRSRDDRRSNSREESRSRSSERRDRDADSGRRQTSRRREQPQRDPIDHGDVPTWDTAVSFVVDNNMITRDGKSSGKKKTRTRSNNKSRN
jgi:hypothetical protein